MAIPESIKKKANQVRNEVYGKDVREALASGIEEAGDIADKANTKSNDAVEQVDNIQAQVNQLVVEGDSSVEAAQARVDAEGKSYPTLKARLDAKETEFSSRLAETENKLNLQDWELNSKARRKQGITVFTSDDGRIEEYTIAKGIFESEGVPQSIAVVPSWIGRNNFCTVEQLLELQNDLGWEIMSHSLTHPQPFPETPDNLVEREFRDSKLELIDMGFNVNNYVYPGGNYGKRERLLAKKYYRAARCSDRDFGGVNGSPLNTYELKTIWLDPSTRPLKEYLSTHTKAEAIQMIIDDCKQSIDRARDRNEMVIISTHFQHINDADYQQMYREVIQYAKNNTKVTTLNEALNIMGNIVDVGDYSETGRRASNETHVVIGADGTISGSASVVERDKYGLESTLNEFPYGVTFTPISYSKATNAPESYSGMLVTYRLEEEIGYNFQEYIVYGSNRIYRRIADSNNNWDSWVLKKGLIFPFENTLSFSNPIGDFNIRSVTYSIITSNDPDIHLSPSGRRGTLITHRLSNTAQLNYSFQEFHDADGLVFKRHPTSIDSWGEWIQQVTTTLIENNEFTPATNIADFPIGITYSMITTDNPDISLTPAGKRGTLITHRLSRINSLSYSYQEYHEVDGDLYRRHAKGSAAWGDWIKISP